MRGPRLVVVSNRLPFTLVGGERRRSVGGLVAALDPALDAFGGTWVGWPGVAGSSGSAQAAASREPSAAGTLFPYALWPVPLSGREVERYYHGFANRALWPLLHSFPGRARFHRDDWRTYDRVNQRFAQCAVEASERERGGLVWFHDYHLLRAPLHFRSNRPDGHVAFFLHVPFPAPDVFGVLPWSRDLLLGLLACNLVGLHVQSYVRNFLDCAERLLGAEVDRSRGEVRYGRRRTRVAAFPLGIDFDRFQALARAAGEPPARRTRLVLGVDRLDYTKGILERFEAIEHFFTVHPEHRGGVEFMQVAAPSRTRVATYRSLKHEIENAVGRINGRLAERRWMPIQYLYRTLSHEDLAALYREADVALVTPLRDGMNLVAKEYVASCLDDRGVLVLSRHAGAAEAMREALLVNPYDVDSVAETLHRALTMPDEERRLRMAALRARERSYDVRVWIRDFVAEAESGDTASAEGPTAAYLDASLGAWLSERPRLALFLDYDGTLAAAGGRPEETALSASMRRALERVGRLSAIELTVVSGHALEEARRAVGCSAATYIGHHGLAIEGPDLRFRHPDLAAFAAQMPEVRRSLERLLRPGMWIEEKGLALTVHHRDADAPRRDAIAERLCEEIRRLGLLALRGARTVEARPPVGWDKGRAVLHVLRERLGRDWPVRVRAIYVGDDRTEEEIFHALAGLGRTIRIGAADEPSVADLHLADVAAVETFLGWVAGWMERRAARSRARPLRPVPASAPTQSRR